MALSAPAVTRVVAEGGKHFAEVTVFIINGTESRCRGPARRNRQEALKDCLELRKVAVKCTDDPALYDVRQRKKELDDMIWTVKDLGGRLLDGAEGPPPGYFFPRTMSAHSDPSAKKVSDSTRDSEPTNRFKGIVKGSSASGDAIVEVADLRLVVPGSHDTWASKAKVALQQTFKKFGPVLKVEVDAQQNGGEDIARVRFASAKAAEAAMKKAEQGYLPMGDGHVRLRQPSAPDNVAIWRKFPPPRETGPAIEGGPSKKKMRPNERFATRTPATDQAPDESEVFWEAQHDKRGAPAEPPPAAPAPEPPQLDPVPAPEKPTPSKLGPDATDEDVEVCKGETDVAAEMAAILEKPFSQQRKALKALRLRWHPDKNPERQEVATRVFQYIQAHDAWLEHHGLT